MASRTAQKAQARERRLAEEQARAERARRERRLRMLGGTVLIAAVIVAVAIAISSGGSKAPPKPNSSAARQVDSTVDGLLAGLPESGNTLGNPKAPVTITEFGDLECPICQEFALGAENQIINNDVRTGKAKLVYRSLETASGDSPIPNVFPAQQAAAYAAGAQGKAWYYIELFYNEQGQEGTGYVTPSFLEGIARQVPGLNYNLWNFDRTNPTYTAQVTADENAANAKGFSSTPTVIVQGPKGTQTFDQSLETYGTYQSAINSVA